MEVEEEKKRERETRRGRLGKQAMQSCRRAVELWGEDASEKFPWAVEARYAGGLVTKLHGPKTLFSSEQRLQPTQAAYQRRAATAGSPVERRTTGQPTGSAAAFPRACVSRIPDGDGHAALPPCFAPTRRALSLSRPTPRRHQLSPRTDTASFETIHHTPPETWPPPPNPPPRSSKRQHPTSSSSSSSSSRTRRRRVTLTMRPPCSTRCKPCSMAR